MIKNIIIASSFLTFTACTMPEISETTPPISSPITIDSISAAEAGGFLCDTKSAQSFLGQKATQELGQDIINVTGAEIIRWVPPRTAITKDLRKERINIFYDDALIINNIYCG